MSKVRVLIADDHTILREGLRALLAPCDDIEVVGEAADGREAIAQVARLCPDVVLMDIAMPGLGGLEATLEIRRQWPSTKVLVLTQYGNRQYVLSILKAGAAGYVVKGAAASELVTAIRAVHRGEAFLSPTAAQAVLERYLGGEEGVVEGYDHLSDREKQVLKLAAEGKTNKEIAALLCLSVKTVMGHRASLMEKLDLHNRTELVRYAIAHGLIEVG
ncbi:MAG TPA: response regulator transcription factor [Dehalococcoidia bacterium]|nr:response regulator transcription factor [Dehalococcoidia bacterium]